MGRRIRPGRARRRRGGVHPTRTGDRRGRGGGVVCEPRPARLAGGGARGGGRVGGTGRRRRGAGTRGHHTEDHLGQAAAAGDPPPLPRRGAQPLMSDQADVAVSYDVDNEFFRLWLDRRMNYTGALFEEAELAKVTPPGGRPAGNLEQAQLRKLAWLHDAAHLTPDKSVLDIGCGWGANLEY